MCCILRKNHSADRERELKLYGTPFVILKRKNTENYHLHLPEPFFSVGVHSIRCSSLTHANCFIQRHNINNLIFNFSLLFKKKRGRRMRDWLSIRNMKTKCGTFSCSVKQTSGNCISYRLKTDDIK